MSGAETVLEGQFREKSSNSQVPRVRRKKQLKFNRTRTSVRKYASQVKARGESDKSLMTTQFHILPPVRSATDTAAHRSSVDDNEDDADSWGAASDGSDIDDHPLLDELEKHWEKLRLCFPAVEGSPSIQQTPRQLIKKKGRLTRTQSLRSTKHKQLSPLQHSVDSDDWTPGVRNSECSPISYSYEPVTSRLQTDHIPRLLVSALQGGYIEHLKLPPKDLLASAPQQYEGRLSSLQTFQLTDVLDPNAFKVTELTTIAEDSDALEDSQSSSEDDDTEMDDVAQALRDSEVIEPVIEELLTELVEETRDSSLLDRYEGDRKELSMVCYSKILDRQMINIIFREVITRGIGQVTQSLFSQFVADGLILEVLMARITEVNIAMTAASSVKPIIRYHERIFADLALDLLLNELCLSLDEDMNDFDELEYELFAPSPH